MMSQLLVDKKKRVDERIIVAVPTRTRNRFKLQAASRGWLRSQADLISGKGPGANPRPVLPPFRCRLLDSV
jgi:hypothetical protein